MEIRSASHPPIRLVCIGGGTGLAGVLRAVRPMAAPLDSPTGAPFQVTAITTAADDGGCSGAVRQEFGAPPPGDIRQCLAALSDSEELLTRLFSYRFDQNQAFTGRSLGNLMLAIGGELLGGIEHSAAELGRLLGARGRVIPSTAERVTLLATLASGERIRGESRIGRETGAIRRVALEPDRPVACASAVAAIGAAHLLCVGPGSLYTSLIPCLLVPGIAEALRRAQAPRLLFLNLTAGPWETQGLSAIGHLQAIEDHAGRVVDRVVADTGEAPCHPMPIDAGRIQQAGYQLRQVSLRSPGAASRHSAPALLRVLLEEAFELARA